jgi:hypothetical protein
MYGKEEEEDEEEERKQEIRKTGMEITKINQHFTYYLY